MYANTRMDVADPTAQAAQQGQPDQTTNPAPEVDATEVPKALGRDSSTLIKLSELLNDSNWSVWKERMKHAMHLCRVEGYVEGTIKRPDDPLKAVDWDYGDNHAQFMLMSNITSSEMVHVSQCPMAKAMWLNLQGP